MKILLDESLPGKLKNDFDSEHTVFTVRDKGWLVKKNVELLRLMIEDDFDFFVTVDRNLPCQQNLTHIGTTVFVLCAFNNRRETLKQFIPKIFSRISEGDWQKAI